MKAELDPIVQGIENQAPGSPIHAVKLDYSTGFLKQLRIVCWRAILNLIRNPLATFLNIVLMVFLGLLAGIIYLDIDSSYEYATQNR